MYIQEESIEENGDQNVLWQRFITSVNRHSNQAMIIQLRPGAARANNC